MVDGSPDQPGLQSAPPGLVRVGGRITDDAAKYPIDRIEFVMEHADDRDACFAAPFPGSLPDDDNRSDPIRTISLETAIDIFVSLTGFAVSIGAQKGPRIGMQRGPSCGGGCRTAGGRGAPGVAQRPTAVRWTGA
jgi:hypothetical protein